MSPHDECKRLSRRRFLGNAAAAGAGAALTAGTASAQDEKKTRVVYRRLGRTEFMTSHVVAAWDWNEWLYQEAVDAGINYWHKIGGWPGLPDALKNIDRETWYCDVVIDSFEEDGAYAQFEWARKNLGLDYIDSFKLHSIYKTPEDVTAKTGMLKAFDRLKAEGKVKHLSAAQHVEPAIVCAAMLETDLFDHLQPATGGLSPTPEMQDVLKLAKAKDVGIIAKKVMGAVNRAKTDAATRARIEPFLGPDGKWGAAVIKGVLCFVGVTAVTPRTVNFEQFIDNLSTDGIEPTPNEVGAIEVLREYARLNQCSYCGKCTGACPNGVAIPETLRYETYASVYETPKGARKMYAGLPAERRANRCGDCGACEAACPQGMAVREKLRAAHAVLT